MEVVNKIKIDMAGCQTNQRLCVMQGDSVYRIVEASLFVDGVPFLVDNHSISVAYKKSDGTSGWYDSLPDGTAAIESTENTIKFQLAPQMMSVPGRVSATIRIEDESGSGRLSTFPFLVDVVADPGANGAESENYYSVQNWDELNETLENIYSKIESGGGGGGENGKDGATFYPSVSSAGVISWTNDGGKENPDPIDLVSAVISALPVYGGEVESI